MLVYQQQTKINKQKKRSNKHLILIRLKKTKCAFVMGI